MVGNGATCRLNGGDTMSWIYQLRVSMNDSDSDILDIIEGVMKEHGVYIKITDSDEDY